MTVRRRCSRLASVLPGLTAGALLAASALAAAPATALAQSNCEPAEGQTITDTPWPQEWFDLDRLTPAPRANGVTVAVIDTGVDDDHPQLDGRVLAGQDLIEEEPGPDGRTDCNGHGTAVASIIAAGPSDEVGFVGLAPGAEILPFRVSVQQVETDDRGEEQQRERIPPEPVAEAIRLATDQGARVINISIAFYFSSVEPIRILEDAVNYALERDVVVVAAAGNRKREDGPPDPPAYPAMFPGVVSVGALQSDGARLVETYVGPGVDLLAPGADVVYATPDGRHARGAGTSFAAAFVSGAAALLIASEPELSGPEVVERLVATADPGPGSAISYAPIVNPYRALTGRVADGAPVAVPAPSEPPPDPAAIARAERWERNTRRAVAIMVVAISLTIIGFIGATVWRRGERLGWRPGQRRDPEFPHTTVDEPERVFFSVPTPRQRR
ncbi:MAG TPA: type VII secretion-associated serine protease mycosin [Natronosporangium sp.]